jgi:hypothetical protein
VAGPRQGSNLTGQSVVAAQAGTLCRTGAAPTLTWPFGNDPADGPRRGRWTLEEIERFKQLWGLRDEAAIARELQRSVASLRKLARKEFAGPVRTGPWSAEEVQRLKRYLGASRLETIGQVIGRSVEDIRARLAQLAVDVDSDPLTGDERIEFKRLYGTRSDEDLAIIFGRRLDVIREVAGELCLSKDKAFIRRESHGRESIRMPRWTEEELEQLRLLYPTTANLEIARILRRSVKSVVSKAHHLSLHKDIVRLQEMGRQNVAIRHLRKEGEGTEPGADRGHVDDAAG